MLWDISRAHWARMINFNYDVNVWRLLYSSHRSTFILVWRIHRPHRILWPEWPRTPDHLQGRWLALFRYRSPRRDYLLHRLDQKVSSENNDNLVHFTKEVNPKLAKPLLSFSGGFAKLGLTSSIKWTHGVSFTNRDYLNPHTTRIFRQWA